MPSHARFDLFQIGANSVHKYLAGGAAVFVLFGVFDSDGLAEN